MIHKFHPMHIFLYITSVSLGVATLVVLYISLLPITILRDWTISVEGTEHHPGEIIAVQSIYKKTRNVSGVSSRYIECKNPNGTYSRYPVNQAKANRAAGNTATGIFLKIPDIIPGLPTKCHVSISIDYKVYAFRTVTQAQSSHDFDVTPPIQTQTAAPQVTTNNSFGLSDDSASPTNTQGPTNNAVSSPTFVQTPADTPAKTQPPATTPSNCTVDILGIHLLC